MLWYTPVYFASLISVLDDSRAGSKILLYFNFYNQGEMQRMIDGKSTLHAKIAQIVFYRIVQ